MGEQQQPCVLFQFRSPALQVYLMTLSGDGSGWSLNQMAASKGDDSLWELQLPLPPGRHRVRYYVDDGRCTVYSDPTDESEATMDGMDLIVDVPSGSAQRL
jgi:hypothetical protein